MSRGAAERRPPRLRVAYAVVSGLVAAIGLAVVVKAISEGQLVTADVLFGLVALVAGALLSWLLISGRDTDPVTGSVVAVVAWAAVAHSSGSGWVQAVGALLAAVLFIGLAAPIIPARRATVVCRDSPTDVRAGQSFELTMVASGPVRIRPRQPGGQPSPAAGGPRGSRTVDVTVTAEHRGVVHEVVVELASCSPFGLMWWAREVEVPLPRPLHVSPRIGVEGPVDSAKDPSPGDAPRRTAAEVGSPRGVRPYRPGDNRRSIHWPATSHVGSLMVRERERETNDPVTIEVVLPADATEAEAIAERVMAAVTHHLRCGQPVVLATHEPGGRVVRVVRDGVDLGRRLARATTTVPDEVAGRPWAFRHRRPPS
jgi:uncharacterized protein (DUF58 family)